MQRSSSFHDDFTALATLPRILHARFTPARTPTSRPIRKLEPNRMALMKRRHLRGRRRKMFNDPNSLSGIMSPYAYIFSAVDVAARPVSEGRMI